MLKTKVSGRGEGGTGNCCVAGEDLHRDFMYVDYVVPLFSACADVYTFRYIFN